MLSVYARHTPDCDHRDELKYRRCRCPKWIDGYVDNQRLRQSAKTRSWEKAELTARSIQEAADPMKAAQPVITTIEDAIDAYVADEKGRNLSKETTKQSKTLFEKATASLGEAPGPHSAARSHCPRTRQLPRDLGK